MVEELFAELQNLKQVEAIALGGSRSQQNYDENSDYDVYVYIKSPISENVRREIIGNHYWEYEDNCVLKNGKDIDIIYRNLDDFCECVSEVVEKYQAQNGYTTCLWHNLINSVIIYDDDKRLEQAQKRFSVPYPEHLKYNIIKRNYNLLCDSMASYKNQIEKAHKRDDKVSLIHRTTAFLESYFDIIFALNSLTHPGEKRLIKLCTQQCKILPADFEANLNKLFEDLPQNMDSLMEDVEVILKALSDILDNQE